MVRWESQIPTWVGIEKVRNCECLPQKTRLKRTCLSANDMLAQVTVSIGGQRITSIITADAAREMRLKRGQKVAGLIKTTDVMIVRA
jgi:molybdopterin-binding protein